MAELNLYRGGPVFGTFDLGQAYADAERVKGMQQDRAVQGERMQMFRDARTQEQELAQKKHALASVEWALQAPSPARALREDPKAAEAFRAQGVDVSAMTDDQAREMLTYVRGRMAAELGEGPPEPEKDSIGTLYPVDENGQPVYRPPAEAVGKPKWREPERERAPTVIVPPANQREFEWFMSLPPEQRDAYLNMKRSNATPEAAAAVAGAKTTATEKAKAGVAAQTDLPRVEANSADMLNVLGMLDKAEGFDLIFGAASLAPIVPGTRQADAFALWEQVQGKAFLEAFNTLKGGGQITEKEGEKATAAITRLSNRRQSPAAARQAIRELQSIARAAVVRAQRKASGAAPQGAPAGAVVDFGSLPPE